MTNMNLSAFNESIGDKESLWHDYNLQISSELLEEFSSNDWVNLENVVFAYPQYWQERCAEAIGYMENMNGVALLISFLESPYMSVAAIAASELENMSISLPKVLESRLLEISEYLKENRSSRCDDLDKLIARLV